MKLADKLIKDLVNMKPEEKCTSSKDGKCGLCGDNCRECWKDGGNDE